MSEATAQDHAKMLRLLAQLQARGRAGRRHILIWCDHCCGYPLNSFQAFAENDPGAGEEGYRCEHCGSRMRDLRRGAEVLVPFEIEAVIQL